MLTAPLLARYGRSAAPRRIGPEYRQIELYTKRKNLQFAADTAGDEAWLPSFAEALAAFDRLESWAEAADPALAGLPTWQRYLALPRASLTDKLTAEIYRMLRIVRATALHRDGHVTLSEGILRIGGAINRVSLNLNLSLIGLDLIIDFVEARLTLPQTPYSDAYIELLLTQYFVDIVGEIKKFADEDRILYQFRQATPFNRHFRFDCDNPKSTERDGAVIIEIGERYRDAVRYPIDFFLIHDQRLHIVPVEILRQGALPAADLLRWQARLEDGLTLPATFRHRFGREIMVVGLPMT